MLVRRPPLASLPPSSPGWEECLRLAEQIARARSETERAGLVALFLALLPAPAFPPALARQPEPVAYATIL